MVIWLGERIESRGKARKKLDRSGFNFSLGPDLSSGASAFDLIRCLAQGMLLIVKGVFQHNDQAMARAVEELGDMMKLPWVSDP